MTDKPITIMMDGSIIDPDEFIRIVEQGLNESFNRSKRRKPMKQKLVRFIPGPLPGRNEAEKAARANRYLAAKMKQTWTRNCECAVAGSVCCFDRVVVNLKWVEKNRRRDPDNIMGGVKYVLDGIVKAGILKNDGWKQIASIENEFETGINPGVWVKLEAV